MTTINVNTNIDATGATAAIDAASATTYVVQQNVHAAAESHGFLASNNGGGLENFGGVYSSTTAAVELDAMFNSVINHVGAAIAGVTGMVVTGGATVNNYGSIVGTEDTGIGLAGGAVLDNHGYVYGAYKGISEYFLGSLVLTNSGTIEGGDYGIDINPFISFAATQVENDGTISGETAGIHSTSGALHLVNHGNIFGGLDLSGDDDVVLNTGAILGNYVLLGGGNDTFNGAGGGATSAAISGGSGNDRIIGGNLADAINGDAGKDVLTGGLGADVFSFAFGDSAVGANRDVITDFHHSQHDRIYLQTIDANTVLAGDQAFVFIGADTFAHYHSLHSGVVGMLRFAGGIVQGNVNANLAPDFEIKLAGVTHLAASDFVL